ncbi:MAG: hypothetical protein AAFY41_00740 [Bacteroidota bacterium]
MAKKSYNTIRMTKNGKVSFKLNRTGFEELNIVVDRMMDIKKLRPKKIDAKIQASLIVELKMNLLRRSWIIKDEYNFSLTVPQALALFLWSNPEEDLMDLCLNIRELNQSIHQQLI